MHGPPTGSDDQDVVHDISYLASLNPGLAIQTRSDTDSLDAPDGSDHHGMQDLQAP